MKLQQVDRTVISQLDGGAFWCTMCENSPVKKAPSAHSDGF